MIDPCDEGVDDSGEFYEEVLNDPDDLVDG